MTIATVAGAAAANSMAAPLLSAWLSVLGAALLASAQAAISAMHSPALLRLRGPPSAATTERREAKQRARDAARAEQDKQRQLLIDQRNEAKARKKALTEERVTMRAEAKRARAAYATSERDARVQKKQEAAARAAKVREDAQVAEIARKKAAKEEREVKLSLKVQLLELSS